MKFMESLMRLLGLFLIFPSAAVARRRKPNDENRIVGGKPAELFDFPFYVYHEGKIEGLTTFCGASLVARDVVLTVS